MTNTLPKEFCVRMKNLLADEYEDFISSYNSEPLKGLRINSLKCSVEKLNSLLDITLMPSPFSPMSFYTHDGEISGNSPLHHCGAFYFQEPSASSAVTILDVSQGEKVLDLCAAPGGKSTQIAALLNNTGVLWSNEIVRSRAMVLLSNIERLGIKNCIVSSLSPDILCNSLSGYFDKVLVDAPCSGEGMFRKDPQAISEWSLEHTLSCGERQLQILNSAKNALKDGGILVYSTCTFSVDENEKVIERFLSQNKDFSLCNCQKYSFGRGGYGIPQVKRIYPMDGGEGHFVAKLIRNNPDCGYTPEKNNNVSRLDKNTKEIIRQTENLYTEIFGNHYYPVFTVVNDKVLIMPSVMPDYKGKGIIRCGILFGEIRKNRIEPAHHLFTSGKLSDFSNAVDFDWHDDKLNDFLCGKEIHIHSAVKGYTAVGVNGMTLGFGKVSDGKLKNKYPKGLRKVN